MRKTLATLSCLLSVAIAVMSTSCGLDQGMMIGEGGAGNRTESSKLQFEPGVPLQLNPNKSAILEVRITPPRAADIRFGIVGDSLKGASLSADMVTTGPDGRARVTFFAPQVPGSLRVRAAWEDPETKVSLVAERPIVIGSLGFGGVVITLTGESNLDVQSWHATCFVGTTCAELDSLETNGTIWTDGVPPLNLSELPAGQPLAIVVSGGNIARGCATLDGLEGGEVRPVQVLVSSVPFAANGAVTLGMGINTVAAPFTDAIVRSLNDELPKDLASEYFLDAVTSLIAPESRVTFAARRKSQKLEEVLDAALGTKQGVNGVLGQELVRIAQSLPESEGFKGILDFDASPPSFSLETCSGVPADVTVLNNPSPWNFALATDGSFIASSSLTFNLLAWLREVALLRESMDGGGVSDELGSSADCPSLAKALSSALPEGEAFPGCGSSCLESLCGPAFGAIWETLGSSNAAFELKIAQSGKLSRDESGALTQMSGTFLGTLDEQPALSGDLSGTVRP